MWALLACLGFVAAIISGLVVCFQLILGPDQTRTVASVKRLTTTFGIATHSVGVSARRQEAATVEQAARARKAAQERKKKRPMCVAHQGLDRHGDSTGYCPGSLAFLPASECRTAVLATGVMGVAP